MNNAPSLPKYHAILVGINSYPRKPLRGCVRDVRAMHHYLLDNSRKPLHAELLIADGNADVEQSSLSQESCLRPTYANVTSVLADVARSANSGDFVYIHFSGHGTRATPDSRFSNMSTGDLALVLLDTDDGHGTKCLWAQDLLYH